MLKHSIGGRRRQKRTVQRFNLLRLLAGCVLFSSVLVLFYAEEKQEICIIFYCSGVHVDLHKISLKTLV